MKSRASGSERGARRRAFETRALLLLYSLRVSLVGGAHPFYRQVFLSLFRTESRDSFSARSEKCGARALRSLLCLVTNTAVLGLGVTIRDLCCGFS